MVGEGKYKGNFKKEPQIVCLFGKIRGSENQKKRKERKGKERKGKERKKKRGEIPGFKNTRTKDTSKSACLGKQRGEV